MPQFAADVVLLHGFTSRATTWERHGWTALLLDAGLRPIALDLPGHGESPPAADVSTPALARHVLAQLDDRRVERVAIVGFSLGGGIALQVALDSPERVTRLVVGGVGDPALHPAEVSLDEPMRRNAERAGNDVDALLPYLGHGTWPGAPTRLQPLPMPVLVILAEADQYMWPADELLERLRPSNVLRLPGRGHHQVLMDDEAKRAAVEFLADLGG